MIKLRDEYRITESRIFLRENMSNCQSLILMKYKYKCNIGLIKISDELFFNQRLSVLEERISNVSFKQIFHNIKIFS